MCWTATECIGTQHDHSRTNGKSVSRTSDVCQETLAAWPYAGLDSGRTVVLDIVEVLANQRQMLIAEEVRRRGAVRVSELTELLGVSDMTIRRDLDVLASAGLIDKVHGGATARLSPSTEEPGFEAKSDRQFREKEAIALAALDLDAVDDEAARGRGRRVVDDGVRGVVVERAGVADLPARLRVEGGAVEDDLALLALVQLFH